MRITEEWARSAGYKKLYLIIALAAAGIVVLLGKL